MATVTQIGPGTYRVREDDETHGAQSIVYVAGAADDLWTFWEGRIYRERARVARRGPQSLTAPMPATVVKIAAVPGQTVRKGDTLVVLEAMKMELPIRAPEDGVVQAINCREGELVQPDRTLVELV